jgi:hypothetical protein
MTVLNTSRLCLVAALVAAKANAFTVAPPVAIDVPMVPGNQDFIASSSSVQTSSSNLPSQRQLLDRVGSLKVAATEPPKAAVAVPAAAPAPKAAVVPAAAAPKSTNAAAKGINIAEIFFDGKVPKTESDEYMVIQNSSKDTIDVSGYIVYPATSGNQGSTFAFPKGSTIKPNSSVRIYTNEIHKETGGYSWGSGRALWSNSGGLGVLKDNNGKKLGEYKYIPPSKQS